MATASATPRTRPFFGRDSELQMLAELLTGGETRVACVHGIAGIGKSELIATFLTSARGGRASVIALDCRTVEPTERGFLDAVGGFEDVAAFAAHVHSDTRPVVLALDHYEVFRLMDTWLRQVLVPALPAGVSLVLAGRERPVAGWFALEGFRTLPLGALDEADALLLLEDRGVERSRGAEAEPDRARTPARADARLRGRLRASGARSRGRGHDAGRGGADATVSGGRR